MSPINIADIERKARQLRAEEIQRIEGLISARLHLYAGLLATSAAAGVKIVSKSLRRLFSWNPQAHHS